MPSGIYIRTKQHNENLSKAKKGKPTWNKGLTKEIDERVKKLSINRKGIKFTEEHKKNISLGHKDKSWEQIMNSKEKAEERKKRQSKITKGENNPFYNKKHTEKSRKQMSEASKGKKKKPFTEEHCKNIGKAQKGKKKKPFTKEAKKNMREAANRPEVKRKQIEFRKDKSYEEIFGSEEKAQKVKEKQSKSHKGKHSGTHIERYGEERAKEISEKISIIRRDKTWEEILGSKEKADERKRKQSERQMGEKNWNWRGGIGLEPYGPEFNNTLKQEIFERDHGICRVCKLNKEQLQFLFKRDKWIFHVHHIDYNKKNNKEENLINLCIKCHLVTNGNRDYWENYFSIRQIGALAC